MSTQESPCAVQLEFDSENSDSDVAFYDLKVDGKKIEGYFIEVTHDRLTLVKRAFLPLLVHTDIVLWKRGEGKWHHPLEFLWKERGH